MIPDKIYLIEWDNKGVNEYNTRWSPAPFGNTNCKNHQYIRKDALLEWAKETYLNEKESAIRKVCYKQLINKIESL